MEDHEKRIQKLEIQAEVTSNDLDYIKDGIDHNKKSIADMKETLDGWNGGVELFTKIVALAGACLAIIIALIDKFG